MSKDKRGDVLPGIGGGLEFNPIPTKEKGEVKKRDTFRKSGHLTDQQLKYTYPKDQSGQLTLWDSVEFTHTKNAIEKEGVSKQTLVYGIKLSPSETKVVDCLCRLLDEKSQTLEPSKEDYYTGNKQVELVQYSNREDTPAPKLAFTLYQLAKEYKGGETINGKDLINVRQILNELDEKKFLISYIETSKTKGGGRVETKIEDFKKLIHIINITQTEFSKENIELNKREETVVALNPIFREQIDSKFILYPTDINKRTIIAYGSHNISDITLRLRDYLLREKASKHYKPQIYIERFYYMLAEKWMKESRKKKVQQYTEKALETVIKLGIIDNYEITEGATGEALITFNINKEWE